MVARDWGRGHLKNWRTATQVEISLGGDKISRNFIDEPHSLVEYIKNSMEIQFEWVNCGVCELYLKIFKAPKTV